MKSSTLATNPVVQSCTYDTKGGAMRRFAVAALAAAVIVLVSCGIASAKATTATKATFGQCGPAVHNGSQLVNAWGAMGVLNSPAASKIAKSAGWKPMDGGMVSFINQRGREFPLAQPANIEDYGCRVGTMYSVGKRHYGAGEKVIVIVPAMYNPNQISAKPRKGYHRAKIWAHLVGRGSCANGFKGYVLVIAYVPNRPVVPAKPQPKKPVVVTKTPPAGSCNATNSPGAVVCSSFFVYVTCGGAQITINGTTQQEAITNASQYVAQNCTSTPPCNCTTPPVVTPTCQDKNANNYGGPLPCTYPPAKCTDTKASNYGGPLPCVYPPPPSHFTNISCTGFEEITGGGSFLVNCSVSNDNGAEISLAANATNGNARVSGINCISQGGSPSCKGAGVFQFRVSGINDGSTILSSAIRATASSNGVDKTFTSDPFPVDPKGGGF